MSKSVLILDTPKMCDDCIFHYNAYDENDCFVDKCMVLKDDRYNDMTIDGYTDRYDGCPLREVPMGIDCYVPEEADYYSYRRGWYDCKSAFLDR
jgi:hypothetical protein